MKTVIFLVTLLIFKNSYSQYYAYEYLKPQILKKNRVEKSIEYDYDDSTNFFTLFPNGNYSVFDQRGKITERNFYRTIENKDSKTIKSCQTTELFIYNNKGDKTTIWIEEENGHFDVIRALLTYTDTLEKKEIIYDLENGIRSSKDIIEIRLKDSIKMDNYTKIIEFDNHNKSDTFKITKIYFSNNLNDSIVQYYSKTNNKIVEHFTYKNQEMETYTKYFIIDGFIESSIKLKYKKNELPTEMWYRYYKNNKIVGEKHTGIKYEYFQKTYHCRQKI